MNEVRNKTWWKALAEKELRSLATSFGVTVQKLEIGVPVNGQISQIHTT